ncbi:MAG: aldehyde dehydrogenase [Coriobacteriia bacterium]|nr:aldehyde dehydrogenase [Coriobacteriia bacterium]
MNKEHISALVEAQREHFATGVTRSLPARRAALTGLELWITEHETDIRAALAQDLGKSGFEAYATEVFVVLSEIRHARAHLKSWMRPRRVPTPIVHFLAGSKIYPDPLGVALIMSPWNYPFQLTLAPLVAALAAGNCAVIKPSAYSPATSRIIARMIGELFDPSRVAVVEGGRAENQALLDVSWDKICFTGSVAVGRVIMEAASKHLTPVTLELGGKSPCLVDETADIKLAARRIAWGKFLNSGQTCVAPDYLYVHESVKDQLMAGIVENIKKFYGDDPLTSESFSHLVNEKHFDRVCALMQGEHVVAGGRSDRATLRIEPTVLDGITWDSPIMQEEIFGPVLPVMTYTDIEPVVAEISARPHPLATYIFTGRKVRERALLERLRFGGGCINDTIVHLATTHLPFGGVGGSGMGAYHGKVGFDTFTHYKGVLKKSNLLDIPLRYPPYKDSGIALLRHL